MALSNRGIVASAIGLGSALATAGVAYALDRGVAQRRRHAVQTTYRDFKDIRVDRSGYVAASDGVQLYYEEVGPADAPVTVVFVHGYCLQLGSFFYQRRAVAQQCGDRVRLVLYDQRSHGRSGRSAAEHCSIDQLGEDLLAVLTERAPKGPVVLVGHSMGGMTVMALAQAHPEFFGSNIKAVCLISTSTGMLASVTLGLPALLARARSEVLPVVLRAAARRADLLERSSLMGTDLAWVLVRRLSFADPEIDPAVVEYAVRMIAQTPMEVISDFYGTLMSHDKVAAMPALVEVPTLLLCGTEDLLTPVQHSAAMADLLPKAILVEVARCGHLLPLENPEAVNEPLITLVGQIVQQVRQAAGE